MLKYFIFVLDLVHKAHIILAKNYQEILYFRTMKVVLVMLIPVNEYSFSFYKTKFNYTNNHRGPINSHKNAITLEIEHRMLPSALH